MHFNESISASKTAARAIVSVLAVSALSLSLVACGSPSLIETPATGTVESTSPTEPSAEPSAEPSSDPQSFEKLQRYVNAQQGAVPQVLSTYAGTYSDFRLEAEAPGTVVFTYVYATQIEDAAAASAALEKTAPQQLQEVCDDQLFPEMRAVGISDPLAVRYAYINADGSTIWEKTFTPSY